MPQKYTERDLCPAIEHYQLKVMHKKPDGTEEKGEDVKVGKYICANCDFSVVITERTDLMGPNFIVKCNFKEQSPWGDYDYMRAYFERIINLLGEEKPLEEIKEIEGFLKEDRTTEEEEEEDAVLKRSRRRNILGGEGDG